MRPAKAAHGARTALACLACALAAATLAPPDAAAIEPHRSFERLVTSNGWAVASYDRVTRRLDTFLEHPYRFFEPRDDPPDLCFSADESRDLAFDLYFGVRSGTGLAARGDWLPDAPLDDAGYLPGTGVIVTDQHVGDGRAVRVRTWSFMPMGLDAPALVLVTTLENVSAAPVTVSPYALFNFHLGPASGGREPTADGEEVSWDAARSTFYEYGPSQGTVAYVALSALAHRTTSTGPASAYAALLSAADLDDASATLGPTTDVAPGFQGADVVLAPGAATDFAVAIVWALDEDAGPDVDALLAWAGGRAPDVLVADEEADWAAWHGPAPAGLTPEEEDLWRAAAAILRMGQVRETGPGFGQILASLPPGRGDPNAQWNISWVRDMAYATVALARAGHLVEAHDALAFQIFAGPGRHVTEVGMPYRLSVTRYFGNGEEESDCNANGPNIEFDGFGLFLWSLGEWVRAGGDIEEVRAWWPTVRAEIADVLVSLIGSEGVIRADSSIWEVHWNGAERRFTYTSLAATRGLCEAAALANALGEAADAGRYAEAGARVRDAVVALHTDPRGALVQSREDLLNGYDYVDAATVEALSWGIIDPSGRVASATLAAIIDNLTVPSGMGYMRNDDGGWYDSQEWVFVDLRLLPALRAAGMDDRAAALETWLAGQALENDLVFSELHDAVSGDYAGSIPMVGFGAGAYLLAKSGGVLEPACGAWAEDPPGLPDLDAGSGDGDAAGCDAGTGDCEPPGGCTCAIGVAKTPAPLGGMVVAALLGLGLFAVRLEPRRGRRNAPEGEDAVGLTEPTPAHALVAVLLLATLLALSLVATACSGCPGRGSDAGLDAGAPFDGLCAVTLTYQQTDATPRVFVAGEWSGFSDATDELLDDGTGTYSITLDLAPGLYAYKLVVQGDGAEPWRLDPANPYRAYDGGIENSGLRVPDCSRPALAVESAVAARNGPAGGRFDAVLRYDPREAGPIAAAVIVAELRTGTAARPLTSGELVLDAGASTITLALPALPDGKHVVRLSAADAAGRATDDVLLPFWIEADSFDWRDALVYMAVTDRYRNGDSSNDPAPTGASGGADWAGGDLAGLTAALEEGYFDTLGVRAIWLTPFNTSPEGVYADADEIHLVAGYHGYWPVDPLETDPRLGGAAALDALVGAAHARGIRILMDLVMNHVHELHPYVAAHPDWFNEGCLCGTAGCDWTARRLDCLFRPYMPDIDWTNDDAGEQFLSDALAWMERFDLDGFRVDAVKHVDDGAVFNLGIRVRERFATAGSEPFLMGETAMGWDPSSGPDEGGNVENYETISRYIRPYGLTGQFDFVLYYAASLSFVNDTPGRGMSHVDYWTKASLSHYPYGAVMTPYIGSHDSSRFITIVSDPALAGNKWDNLPPEPSADEPYDRMYVALAWLLAIPGAPLLYYGDEYGEYGGADPDNRHVFRAGAALSARETAQLARVRALGAARARLSGLRRGAYRTLDVTETFWSIARGEGADLVIVALNRSAAPATVTIPVPTEVAGEGRAFADELGSGMAVTVEQAALTVALPAWSAVYLH